MSRGVNRAIIIGNLGNDPEVKYTANSNAIANITVATSESWTDKNTNEKRVETEWHRIVFYGKLAEIAGQYLKKGSKVYIEGKLKTRKWQDQQGVERYTTEIIANEMQMLESKQMDAPNQQPQQPQQPQQRPQQVPQQGYQQPQQGFNQPQQRPQSSNSQAMQQGYQKPTQQRQNQSQQSQQSQPNNQQYQDFESMDFKDDIPFQCLIQAP